MKKIFLHLFAIVIFCFGIFSSHVSAQTKARTFHPTYRNLLVSAGYVPDSDFQAFKGMVMVNNIIKKRVGVYYSFENGIAEYSENILGGTFGINQFAFVYAGLGIDKHQDYDDARITKGSLRKEAGVGFTPYKFTAVTIGWSPGVGYTFTVGMNITLWDKRDKSYTVDL